MATLILTAVGTVFGGPLGGALGALAGQAVDAQLFKPAGREGPRVTDLRVQTSAYGTAMPRIYGRMRVAGSVIWATDLVEHNETSGGKGQPDVTTYSYSANFAVAISSRPILRVERIWADGNLLRGAGGDFKTGVGAFRLHTGLADQPVDPLIAADKTPEATPASRGLAYAVFEGLQLADYGNRIPSLTFEVIADEAAVPLTALCGDLVTDLSVAWAGAVPTVDGYAASGASAGEAVAPLTDAFNLLMRTEADGRLVLTAGNASGVALRATNEVRTAGGRALARREEERKPAQSLPRRLSLRHYDPDRDYQGGLQSAERQGTGDAEVQIDLPAVIPAAQALDVAGKALRHRYIGRRTITVHHGWKTLSLAPGDLVILQDETGSWRIEETEWEGMALRLSLRAVPSSVGPRPGPAAESGTNVVQTDHAIGPTHLTLIETPQLTDDAVTRPQLFALACGDMRHWRRAPLFWRSPSDGALEPMGPTAAAATLGRTISVLGSANPALLDLAGSVDVLLFNSDAILAPVDDVALLNGANACMIGDELVQFGGAQQVGPRRWRLSRLLRGRRGTEGFTVGHGIGEDFVLLDSRSLRLLPPDRVEAGRSIEIAAQGLGDDLPVVASHVVTGRAMLPLTPVALRMAGDIASGIDLGWTRRSRMGWSWPDGNDAPLAEEREAYVVQVVAAAIVLRTVTVDQPLWHYDPAFIAVDEIAAAGAPRTVHVRQQGTFGLGAAAILSLDL